ncbi:DUF498 domain-containing protein [Neurospora crassa OR74A]|uniref:DUF498 domain-containing protein n=1 Tax=Neurospora crassa (strain ATCC 24698 / 74-OR23-1A / CBS 708.71 / DSM 1257 / FGSC 987) TaxID=367110 RepID=Q7SBV1_NEUCR|nr:DUF498 domain-containing protein [Neurospora crassa OR74A]EAA33883.2 DUF498 domain-containing protein [Neurospora crassa OR74A]|eukprot:XP_963119.2 DUF498 domain-containing protein [Neurospora crassa OR74A]
MTFSINSMRSTVLRYAVQRTTALTLSTPRVSISRPISFSPSLLIITTTTTTNHNDAATTLFPPGFRRFTTTPQAAKQTKQKLAHNNEPVPDSPPTTDFGEMDMLGQTPVPSTAIDECFHDGFALNSGVQVTGGSGVLLVGGEAFEWRPWVPVVAGTGTGTGTEGEKMGKAAVPPKRRKLVNEKGQWDVSSEEQWGFLGRLWPRPDLLILGVGPSLRPLSPATRAMINSMGIRVEVLDTRNAASQYNLLATERGVDQVAAALVPLGWRE